MKWLISCWAWSASDPASSGSEEGTSTYSEGARLAVVHVGVGRSIPECAAEVDGVSGVSGVHIRVREGIYQQQLVQRRYREHEWQGERTRALAVDVELEGHELGVDVGEVGVDLVPAAVAVGTEPSDVVGVAVVLVEVVEGVQRRVSGLGNGRLHNVLFAQAASSVA